MHYGSSASTNQQSAGSSTVPSSANVFGPKVVVTQGVRVVNRFASQEAGANDKVELTSEEEKKFYQSLSTVG